MSDTCRFLDPHLVIRLLEPLADKKTLVEDTKQIYAKRLIRHDPDEKNQAQTNAQPLLNLINDQASVHALKQKNAFNIQSLEEDHCITSDHVLALKKYAKFEYECGNYEQAETLLATFRTLTNSPDDAFSALWGKLACEILLKKWDAAIEDINALREAIDARSSTSALMQLQQRAWLMHWALFVLVGHPSGPSLIIEIFLLDAYAAAIQTLCPHLLRYLTVAVILSPRKRTTTKDVLRMLDAQKRDYEDSVTKFFQLLYQSTSFDESQSMLVDCKALLTEDLFLTSMADEFTSNARLHIFESYCRIHQRIYIPALAEKLGMDDVTAEKWIVKMISDAQLKAKIDSETGHIILGAKPPDVYEQVIEKTKGLTFRTNVIAQNISVKHSDF